MRRFSFIFVVLAAVLAFGSTAYAESEAALAVKAGLRARTENDLAAARASFAHAAELDGDPDASAEALFQLGDMDEQEGAYARALARYEASGAKSPSSRYAPRAATRAAYLHARSEGGFKPLARLETFRKDAHAANDPSAIDTLAKDLETFPQGLVKVEARMVVAEAYVGRLDRRADAIAQYRHVIDDPAADPLTARQAARALVDAHLADGDTRAAERDAQSLNDRLDPKFVASVTRVARRGVLRAFALGDLATFALLAVLSLASAWRRSSLGGLAASLRKAAPLAVVFAAYVALVGGFLASKYEAGNAKPFLALGVALMPVLMLSRAWGAVGSTRIASRLARGGLCASSAVAAAFVLLEQMDPAYLESFGL